MEQSAADEEECGICLDELTNPVALPCSHKFCSECLNGWRSKYGARSGDKETNTKCPLCREKIPPSKEMVTQLKWWRNYQRLLEADGNIFSQEYMTAKSMVEELERAIEDCTETIDYSDDDNFMVLPNDICEAAYANDIQKVLDWLGPLPVDKQRIDARCPDIVGAGLVYFAALREHSDLLSILLQLGADVDAVDANGFAPLGMMCLKPENYAQARLLLEWGAEISDDATHSKNVLIEKAHSTGNSKLANLLKSEFGGRRCEIVTLPNRPDLVGKTCVVEKYLPDKGRYKVTFGTSQEVGLVGPDNLVRRDRTPDDCGYYITYKNGRYNRHEFASKEECQAFISSSLTEGDQSGDEDGDVDAEARAEQAAASLLAELSIDSSGDARSKKKCKQKKGKKKGRK